MKPAPRGTSVYVLVALGMLIVAISLASYGKQRRGARRITVTRFVIGVCCLVVGCTTEEADRGTDRPLFDRWAWDATALYAAPGDSRVTSVLPAGTAVRVGPVRDGFREVRVDGVPAGWVGVGRLRREPSPTMGDAYRHALVAIEREFAFPHTVTHAPRDSVESHDRGGGVFDFHGRLTAEDGRGRGRHATWTVRLRRAPYRWIVDSIRITVIDGSDSVM